jgi:hypothetical protein
MSDSPSKYIILRLDRKGLFYNATQYIGWQTNFPDSSSFKLHDHKVFWLVKMISFNDLDFTLQLEISNYNYEKSEEFLKQRPSKEIKAFVFKNVVWKLLKPCFLSTDVIQFKQSSTGLFKSIIDDINENLDTHNIYHLEQSISKLTFKLGYVETHKAIAGVSRKVLIQVYNPFIIPEFEYIKPYFSQVFNSRKISITGHIADKNLRSSYKFYSPEIELIDKDLIEGIKRLELNKKIKRPKVNEIDKSLFTPEEYFDGFERELGNTVKISDADLVEQIIGLEGIRNQKQLEYLSGYLHNSANKIYFSSTPSFGFIFYITGTEMNHYVWELLDSNATYLWSFDQSLSKNISLSILTQQLNIIHAHGRNQYLVSEQNDELIFNRVNHKHAGSSVIDGFPRWHNRLSELLV